VLLIEGEIFFEDLGDGQVVRAPVGALAILLAKPHGLHSFFGEARRLGRTHTVGDDAVKHGRGDVDPLRTGLAVLATVAKQFSQLLAVLLHQGQIFGRDLVVGFIEVQDLIYPVHRIPVRQRNDVRELPEKLEF
jgi:hypothetical protein